MPEKVKGGLFYLGTHMYPGCRKRTDFDFDEDTWNAIVDAMADAGMNSLFLDIHEGLHYGSHPELAVEDAWTRQRMRKEIKRLKEKGMIITPKLNFSTCHDFWLGPYEKMVSTPTYYQVCRDLIRELCELFADTPYFHLGMDEEDYRHAKNDQLVVYRRDKQLWYDMQFLMDCVRDCGKTPVIWGSIPVYNYEEFKANISPEDMIIMHYYYNGALDNPEHWTRTDSREDYYQYYHVPGTFGGMGYAGMGMEYIERDDPYCVHFRKNALRSALDGYDTILCCSNFYEHPHNADDVVEMVMKDWPEERVKGIITCPWYFSNAAGREKNLEGIRLMKEAYEKFDY